MKSKITKKGDNKVTIKVNQVGIPYSHEEKQRLFSDGLVRSMAQVQKNKKTYNRKDKHKSRKYSDSE